MPAKKNPERLFDLRTIEHLISNGAIKQSEYDKHLKSLPDDEGNYDLVNLEEEAELEAGFDEENETEDNEWNLQVFKNQKPLILMIRGF